MKNEIPKNEILPESSNIDELKKRIVDIINNPDEDEYDAINLLKQNDPDKIIQKSNDVQRALVKRIKFELEKGPQDFNLDSINPFAEMLSLPETLEIDDGIKEAAWRAFYYNNSDYSIEDWASFLARFNMCDDPDVIDVLKGMIEHSIFEHNNSNEEISEFLSDIVHWFGLGNNESIREEIEKIIKTFQTDGHGDIANIIKKKLEDVGFETEVYKDSAVYREKVNDDDDDDE